MTTVYGPAFAVLLREFRDAAALTQEQLAERSGVSVRAISDLERGAKTRPQRATVRLLADGLGLDADQRAVLESAAPSRHRALDHTGPRGDLPHSRHGGASPPTNLVSEPTPFIGRKQEMAQLSALLDQPGLRLVTLTGPGGSGKTRLALEVAGARLSAYPDGNMWISLAPLADPALVAPTIAAVLGVRDTGERSPLETLTRALRDKQILLVLDNFEHLLEAASLVGDLLRACPSVQILVTSRAVLHLAAEYEYPVPPLPVPTLTLVPDLDVLSQSDAAALFVDRARAARPDFVLTHENAPYVAAICHRLDGLPLAIELAAARTRVLPPQALLARLSRRFEILTGGARDRPIRQQTLQAAIDWSYSLLTPEEQALFARLSVFTGGWALDAAQAVCNAEENLGINVLDGTTALVEQSLVRQEGTSEPRFQMLETIREYAAQKLEEGGEEQEIRRRHAIHFLDYAERIRPQLDGPKQSEGFARLEEEHNNLRAAVDWARDSGEVEMGLRLAIALESFADRGYVTEVGGWFDDLLTVEREHSIQLDPSLRTEALQLGALCATAQGDREKARALAEESIAILAELSDRREVAYRLHGAGFLLRELGDFGHATRLLSGTRSLFTEVGDRAGLGVVLVDLGDVAREEGDAGRIREVCEESVRICHEVGNTQYEAFALQNLGVAARMLGELDRGRVLCAEALRLYARTGMVRVRAEMLASLAGIAREQGDLDRAETLLAEGLELAREGSCEIETVATVLEGMAGLAAARGHGERAAKLFGATSALRERIGRPVWPVNRPGLERDLASARESLGVSRFDTLRQEGSALTVDEAIACALQAP